MAENGTYNEKSIASLPYENSTVEIKEYIIECVHSKNNLSSTSLITLCRSFKLSCSSKKHPQQRACISGSLVIAFKNLKKVGCCFNNCLILWTIRKLRINFLSFIFKLRNLVPSQRNLEIKWKELIPSGIVWGQRYRATQLKQVLIFVQIS